MDEIQWIQQKQNFYKKKYYIFKESYFLHCCLSNQEMLPTCKEKNLSALLIYVYRNEHKADQSMIILNTLVENFFIPAFLTRCFSKLLCALKICTKKENVY